MTEKKFHLHLVSDATGETINSIARACVAQFQGTDVHEHFWSLIRSKRQLDVVFEAIRQWPGLVLFTFVDRDMQRSLVEFCQKQNTPSIAVLDPVLNAMSNYFGTKSAHDPGRQHALDAEYFARIDAMDYALALDDGNKTDKLNEADVVILGVSRTSKTPTCIYLANRGIRAANVPIIPGINLSIDFDKLTKPLIVGLTKDPDSLVEIRLTRLQSLQQDSQTDYVDVEKVHEEVANARRLYARLGCPVIDVSHRSIEETAAEIMTMLNRRQLEREIKAKAEAEPKHD